MKKEMLKKAQGYVEEIRNKWNEICNTKYLCYEDNVELACKIVYDLFELDIINDTETYCRTIQEENGYIFKLMVRLDTCLYFQFDIITKYGIDIPQRINNGKFRILNKIPKGWKEIEDLINNEE